MIVALVVAGAGPSPLSADGTSYGSEPVGGAAQQASGDYDADNDGLIEIRNLAQLDAIRYDLDGDGTGDDAAYSAAFPNAMIGMGCAGSRCVGYELAADLDFDTDGSGEADAGDAYWNDDAGWLPMGGMSFPPFTAAFDGAGHTISNLYINRYVNPGDADHIGLFGMVGSGGIIGQVRLEAANVSGCDAVGALVGTNGGVITDSYAVGSVYGDQIIGGLVGANGGAVTDSYFTGDVSGNRFIGGLVGTNGGPITGSYATGDVSGDDHIGGLVGENNSAITDSYFTGDVSGDDYVGGLVGLNNSSITDSIATGNVSGDDLVGGLVGDNDSGGIVASYSAVSTSGDYTVGGLVGANSRGAIVASYSVGSVVGRSKVAGLAGRIYRGGTIIATYTAATVSGRSFVGGLVGYGSGTIELSYWDIETTGQTRSVGGEGKTTQELQSPTDYTGIYAAWNIDLDNADRDGNLATGGDDLWDFGSSSDYPRLRNAILPLGDPTGLRVATIGNGQVTLEWQPGSNADAHWVVWLQHDSAGVAKIVDVLLVSGDASSATVTGLKNGQSYVFVVFASRTVDGKRQLSAPSNLVAATVEQDQATSAAVPQLYWVDEAANKIQRTNENDSRVVQDLVASGLDDPGSIALDPVAGKMYWTDDGAGQIQRADLDGNGVEVVKAGLSDPVGIALDPVASHLYWADRHWGAIYRGNLREIDDLTAEPLVANLDRPYQIALDTINGHMYWTERGENTSRIRRADLSGSNVTDVRFGSVAPLNPFGLALDPVAGKMYWTERSSDGDLIVGSDLDGQNGDILVRSEPRSLSGITVDVNDGKIYWTDEEAGTILSTDPTDPTGAVETVVTGLSAPEGIAIWAPFLGSTRLALTALYRATGGPDWDDDTNWLGDAPLGEWYGVTTADELGENTTNLVGLALSDNGLEGKLPSMLGNLHYLESLDLSNNRLTGPIPEGLAEGLDVLKMLDLSGNTLSGRIPSGLGNQHLTGLDLSRNQLHGSIPEELGTGLVSLRRLDLSHNLLSGGTLPPDENNFVASTPIPERLSYSQNAQCLQGDDPSVTRSASRLGNLANLEVLNLSDNRLSGEIPGWLCTLDRLQVLDLSRNRIRGEMPRNLDSLSNLRVLRLAGQSPFNKYVFSGHGDEERLANCGDECYLAGAIPPNLGNLAELRELNFGENRLSEEIPHQLGNLSRLRLLYLYDNGLSGSIPQQLGNLSNLELLTLGQNRLSGTIEASLSDLTNLRQLYLHDNDLSGSIPQQLGNLSRLEVLNLSKNRLEGIMPAELGSLTRLERLNLSDNRLSGEIPPVLNRLSALIVLGLHSNEFEGCLPITPARADILGVAPGVNNLPQLCPTEEELLERAALSLIFDYLGGEEWTNSTNWNTEAALDEWYGVSTYDDGAYAGHVRGLDLSNNNLQGSVHWVEAPLLALERVESVNMQGNSLRGCVPPDLQEKLDAGRMLSGVDIRETPDDLDAGVLSGILNNAVFQTAAGTVTEIFAGDSAATAVGISLSAAQLADRMRKYDIGGLGLPICPPDPPDYGIVALDDQNTQTDREVLLAIKNHFVEACEAEGNSENSCIRNGKFETWITSKVMEDWHGVDTADRLKVGDETIIRVTRLSLDDRDLTGTIPEQLGSLGRLRHLNLSHNRLKGSIPAELGHLLHLRTLALNDNQLSSGPDAPPIPPALGNLWRLEKLYLQNNNLTGYIPPELDVNAASSLRVMDIDKGEITGCLEPNLRFLSADIVTSITDTVILTIASSGASISITAPSGIARAANLALGRLVPVSLTAARGAFVGTVVLANPVSGPITRNTATMVTEKAMRSVEGPVGEGLSALLGPTERVSEIIGRLAEFVGWHGLGGEMEMDEVYCQR